MNQYLIILIAFAIFSFIAFSAIVLLAWSARKTLIKGGTSWSAKTIPMRKRVSSQNNGNSKTRKDVSILEKISEQTSEYLNYEKNITGKD
tara:strand:+ start:2213 stop:2482 length:270 start_codon:yes stop_codon:yes gene_type:complete